MAIPFDRNDNNTDHAPIDLLAREEVVGNHNNLVRKLMNGKYAQWKASSND